MSKKRRTSKETPIAAKADDEPDHELVRLSWLETIEVMKERRSWQMPTSSPIVRDDPKVARARAMFPQESAALDAYNEAIHRTAQFAKAKLGADRTQRRLGIEYQVIKDTRTMEQKLQDDAVIEHGKALIAASDPLEDYKAAVWAGYGTTIGTKEAKSLAIVAHRYGLNPAPGLDLIYGWYENTKDGGKQFKIHISYKGWLALCHRYKKFIYSHRQLDEKEVQARGNNPAEVIVFECKALDFNVIEMVKQAKEAGFDIDQNDYFVRGYGVFKKGSTTPKGRDGSWVAKKDSSKDMAAQLLAEVFNINVPVSDDMTFERENNSWVVAATDESGQAEDQGDEGQPAAGQMVIEGEFTENAKEPAEPKEETPEQPESPAPVKAEEPAAESTSTPAAAARDLRAIYTAGLTSDVEVKEVPKAVRIVGMLQNVVKPQLDQATISGVVKTLITNSTLNHVTTEEWRGILAVININPSADEVRALLAEKVEA